MLISSDFDVELIIGAGTNNNSIQVGPEKATVPIQMTLDRYCLLQLHGYFDHLILLALLRIQTLYGVHFHQLELDRPRTGLQFDWFKEAVQMRQ